MTTRATLILNKIQELETNIKALNLGDKYELFEDWKTQDLADIVFLLSITFQGVDTEEAIKKIITDMLKTKGLQPYEFAVHLMYEFVVWFQALK